jgi:hypothetical protein
MADIVEALDRIPGLACLVPYCVRVYGMDKCLTFRQDGGVGVLDMRGGVPQGATLAPLLYGLLTVGPLKRVAAAHPGVAVMA